MKEKEKLLWKGLELEEFLFEEIAEHINVSARSGGGLCGAFASSSAIYPPAC